MPSKELSAGVKIVLIFWAVLFDILQILFIITVIVPSVLSFFYAALLFIFVSPKVVFEGKRKKKWIWTAVAKVIPIINSVPLFTYRTYELFTELDKEVAEARAAETAALEEVTEEVAGEEGEE